MTHQSITCTTSRTSLATQLRAWAGILAMAATGTVWAAQPLGCIIEAERMAEVGSQFAGVIEEVKVERGDRVHKGQVVAVLSSDIERASLSVAKSKAQNNADVQAADANLALARQKLMRAGELAKKNFISTQAFDQTRFEYDLAVQKLEQTREQQRMSQRELNLAQAQLAQRTIRSPFDGIIADRYLSAGERIELQPLVRIIKVDRLRVQVVVPHTFFSKIHTGDSASVMPDLPGTPEIKAPVTMVDQALDAASNTFRVQLLLPNKNLTLPAGLRCKVTFDTDTPIAGKGHAPAKRRPVGTTQPTLKLDASLLHVNQTASAKPKRLD